MAEKKEEKGFTINLLYVFAGILVIASYFIFSGGDEEADAEKEPETKQEETTEEPAEETGKLSEEELVANQKENLQNNLKDVMDAHEDILDIHYTEGKTQEGEFMDVVVSDAWYNTPIQEKERFAKEAHESVSHAVWNSGLQEHGETIIVNIFDSEEKEVASFSIFTGEYEIED